MRLPNILFPVFMFPFIFHRRSFSPWWPLAFLIFSPTLWISMFSSLRNSSPLFSITRSSSFSVIHVSVNIKNNAEKDTTLLFFLSKSPGGHVISFQIKPWVAFGLPYPLIEIFYSGMPVVQTDGPSLARCGLINTFPWLWGSMIRVRLWVLRPLNGLAPFFWISLVPSFPVHRCLRDVWEDFGKSTFLGECYFV